MPGEYVNCPFKFHMQNASQKLCERDLCAWFVGNACAVAQLVNVVNQLRKDLKKTEG